MKLGDVLPHWIFRERAGVDLEVGGSAFAHLVEDVGSGGVVADWPISAPVFLSQDDNANTTTSASLAPGALALWKRDDLGGTRAIGVGLWSDNEYRTLIHGDGSLHWGGGAAAPDTSLRWDFTDDFAKMILNQLLVVGDYAADNVSIDSAGVVFVTDRFESTRNGGPIVLKAPNGTRYAVTVSNAGAIAIAPA